MADRIIQWNDTSKDKFISWGIDDYIAWHRGLVKHFGNEKAKKKDGTDAGITKADYAFMMAFAAYFIPKGISASYGGGMQPILTFPSHYKEQINYFKKYPTLYETLGFKNIESLTPYNPVNLAANVVKTTVGVVGDITDTIGSVVKILKVVAIAAVIGGAIWGGVYLYKKSQAA